MGKLNQFSLLGARNSANWILRNAKKLRSAPEDLFLGFLSTTGAGRQAGETLAGFAELDKETFSMPMTDMMLFVEECRKVDKINKQALRRSNERRQERKTKIKELQKSVTEAEEKQVEEREPWTAAECLAFKTENDLCFKDYQQLRNQVGPPLLPKQQVQDEETKLTQHMTLTPVIEGAIHRGYVVDLKQLLTDAIKSKKFDLVPGDNDVKLTGDGGGLYGDRPMMVMFVQSLMKRIDAQGLDGTQPAAILVEKENYKSVALAAQVLNSQITELERNGITYNRKKYKFSFFFAADLKFTWVVRNFVIPHRGMLSDSLLSLDSWNEIRWALLLPTVFGESGTWCAQINEGTRAIRKITNSLYSLFLFSLHLSFELQ